MLVLSGCAPALLTPFNKDGSIDYEAYASMVDRQVAGGADFLVPLATTGETPTLSNEEKVKLLQITREHSNGLPLLVGAGSNSVPGTLANMDLLRPCSPDAWLIVVPFYNKPTQEGQFLYFKEIASHSKRPIVIYNVPGRTGANMAPETVVRLSEACPNIIGIKEASGRMDQVRAIIDGLKRKDFAVLSGDDDKTLEMIRYGAKGVISVAANIFPDKVSNMVHAAMEKDYRRAEHLDFAMQNLYKTCFIESNPIPAKAAMNILGICSDTMRLPLVPASESTRALMQEIIYTLSK